MSWLRSVFAAPRLDPQHEWFMAQLSEIERRQVDLEVLAEEMEARVAILEGEHADELA